MLVYPDSQIQFFKRIPLEPGGVNKVWYGTTAQKDAAFTALFNGAYGSGQVTNCTYHRENKNRVRVELPIATLYAANYMRFRNTSFENKWYYAFIVQVNYINNTTTEVVYEIDYFTTWGGTFVPEMCFVERQHVENDAIGANILEEGLPVGAYVNEGSDNYSMGSFNIFFSRFTGRGLGGDSVNNGIYNAADVTGTIIPLQIEAEIDNMIENNKDGNIVGVFQAPPEFYDYDANTHMSRSVLKNKSVSKPYNTINGYTPKNNKLFVYPYKFLLADNSEGSAQEYRYEWFSDAACNFELRGIVTANCEVTMYPTNYNGIEKNLLPRLGMKDFPQCPYAVDTYKAYLAQKNAYLEQDVAKIRAAGDVNAARSIAGGVVSGLASGAAIGAAGGSAVGGVGAVPGAIVGGLIGGAAGGINAYLDAQAQEELLIKQNAIENEIRPSDDTTVHGAISSNAIFAARLKGYYFYKRCITADVAKTIDDYFSLFGYKISKNRVFNMRARETYTYIKTVNCEVGGELPAFDKAVINAMFNAGVRVWRRVEDVGNYNLSNNPVSPG